MTTLVSGQSQDNDFAERVLLGTVPNVSRITSLGLATIATTSAVPQDIWPGAAVYPFMTAATSLEVLSNNVNDTAAGTGAQQVIISGLDINYNTITSTINLNGTTVVAVPTQFFRINSARCALITPTTGSQTNIGTITIRDAGGGTTRAIINPGIGTSQQAIYTVPNGFLLTIQSMELQIPGSAGGTARGTDAFLVFRQSNGFYFTPRKLTCTDVQPYMLIALDGIPVTQKTDFFIRCTYASANNMQVGAAWEGHLYKL
jgi:hypothetical protein